MRKFLVIAAIVTNAIGAGPSTSGGVKVRKTVGGRPEFKKRDAIVESVYLDHPGWTTRQVLIEVAPLIAAAGLPPISYEVLRHQMTRIAKNFGFDRRFTVMTPHQVTFMQDLFATDPTLPLKAVVAAFRRAFGPDALTRERISTWWNNHTRRHRYVGTNEEPGLRLPIVIRTPAPETATDGSSEEHPIVL